MRLQRLEEFAIALAHADNRNLPDGPPASFELSSLVFVGFLATDVCLIRLHDAREEIAWEPPCYLASLCGPPTVDGQYDTRHKR